MRQIFTLLIVLLFTNLSFSQTIADFETFNIGVDTFDNGIDGSGGFMDGNVFFPNLYNTDFNYWQGGWAISTVQDSTTSGFANIYGAKAFTGYDGSTNYAIGQNNSKFHLTGDASGGVVSGLYITNTTYAHNSMRDGDDFAKEFGGTSGDDPDFFKLTIHKYLADSLYADSVEFYLADFRDTDNSNDYIVNAWEWVDLTSLGNVDSLLFVLSSSDVGMNGMNTPAFFAVDNVSTADAVNTIEVQETKIFEEIYPNPVADQLFISFTTPQIDEQLIVRNLQGQVILAKQLQGKQVNVSTTNWLAGIYFVEIRKGNQIFVEKVVKF